LLAYIEPMLAEKMPGLTDHKIPTVLKALTNYDPNVWACEEKYDGERVTLARSRAACSRRGVATAARTTTRLCSVRFRSTSPTCSTALPDDLTFTIDGEEYVPGGYSSDAARLENANKLVLTCIRHHAAARAGHDAASRGTNRRELLEELFSRSAFNKQTAVKLCAVYSNRLPPRSRRFGHAKARASF
jgi:hypothetical protein